MWLTDGRRYRLAATVRRDWIIPSILSALTLALYYPVVNFQFLCLADPEVVTRSPIFTIH